MAGLTVDTPASVGACEAPPQVRRGSTHSRMWYSSHVFMKKAQQRTAQMAYGKRSQPGSPAATAMAMEKAAVPTSAVFAASQPWSKSSPRGDDAPRRRACLPSILSSVEYAARDNAAIPAAQRGAAVEKFPPVACSSKT